MSAQPNGRFFSQGFPILGLFSPMIDAWTWIALTVFTGDEHFRILGFTIQP